MHQTRRILISERVFSGKDLSRIAEIFDKQAALAKKSDHHSSLNFVVRYSDDTTLEGDSSQIFDDESLVYSARPVAIRMSFNNYKLKRSISLSLDHGDSSSSFTNAAELSAEEPAWLGENFLAMKEALDVVRPQTCWLRKHPTILFHLIAVGIGCIAEAFFDGALTLLFRAVDLSEVVRPLPQDSPWRRVIASAYPFFYLMGWLWRWMLGSCFGAYSVHKWLLAAWPKVELDIGLDHLKMEKSKRQRLQAALVLGGLPIAANLLTDLIKWHFSK
ncbi:MAG: hypothetical protein ABMA26_04125 [Limisphaerales bacterium]